MSKVLITSGCSFSECTQRDPKDSSKLVQSPNTSKTWPSHLYKELENYGFTKFVSTAMGSQGNGLISRGVLYNVIKHLETHKPEDILVGVMWSDSNRWDYRCSSPDLLSWYGQNVDGWIENPTGFVEDSYKHWVIMNKHWQNEEARNYYKYFHDFIGSSIASLEHILRLQWFLKSKNVNYFFTNFTDNNIIDITSSDYNIHRSEIDYLYEQIDFSMYLPVTSEHRWVYENAVDKEEYQKNHLYNGTWTAWIHPQKHHHKQFTDEVIIPWLKERNFI